MQTLNVNIHHFAPLSKNTQTDWSSCVLLYLELLMKPSDALQNGSFWHKKCEIWSWLISSV